MLQLVRRRGLQATRQLSLSARQGSLYESSEYGVFPNEREGNVYSVNWSLTVDGITPVGDAYRNARIPLLTSRLPVKVDNNAVELKAPLYTSEYKLKEAGDNITQDAFTEESDKQVEYFESGIEMFVEDGGLGAFAGSRVPVRVVTDSAAVALIARTLLVPMPPREVDHRARYDGWNLDERWIEPNIDWKGSHYDIVDPSVWAKGERPVVAVHGGAGADVAVQFVENKGKIVGANATLGGAAPIRALIDSLGHASCVYANEDASQLALPSLSLASGTNTVLVVGADDAVLKAATSKPTMVYGAYHNILSVSGVSAMWNGYIADAGAVSASSLPAVVVGGLKAVATAPYNLVHPAKHILFYEKGAKKADISEEEAVKRLVALTDDAKKELAAALVKGVKLSVIGGFSDLPALA